MSALSGEKICPQRPQIENQLGKPHPFPQRPHQVYTPNTQYHIHKPFRRRPKYGLVHKVPRGLQISPERYDPGDCYRRSSTTDPPRRASSGVTKRGGRLWQPIPLRPRKSVDEDTSTQADTSHPILSEPGSDTSSEQDFTVTSTSLPDSNTNEETAARDSVGKDSGGSDGICFTNEVPSSEREQQDSEGDNAAGLHEDEELAASPPLIHPNTEYHANLAAASEECRDLFLDYYERTHGEGEVETEDHTDPYWKWDQKRYQWFHEDPDTKSVVWFSG